MSVSANAFSLINVFGNATSIGSPIPLSYVVSLAMSDCSMQIALLNYAMVLFFMADNILLLSKLSCILLCIPIMI